MSANTPQPNDLNVDLRWVPPWEVVPKDAAGLQALLRQYGLNPDAAATASAAQLANATGSDAAAAQPPKPARKKASPRAAAKAESSADEAAPLDATAMAAAAEQRAKARAKAASRVQALDPLTLPLSGSRLIEASAGTGKTYTIAQLYVRLVLGHGSEASRFARALTPPEILVVTFTDAATQELRDRIRQRLGQAAAVFEDGMREWPADYKDLLALREHYAPEQWPGCAKLLRVAADWMDEAAVSTIHSWCYRMLREHAFDSGNLFTQTLITDESEMRLEAARDYWRRNFYDLTHQEAATLAKIMASPEQLAKDVKNLLVHSDSQWQFGEHPLDVTHTPLGLLKQYSATLERLQDKENAARQLWRDHWAEIEPIFLQWKGASFARSKLGPGVMAEWLADLRAWSEGEPAPDGKGKKPIHFFGQAKLDEYGKGSVPNMLAFVAIDEWLDAVSDTASQINDKQLLAQLLAHATQEIHATLDQEKRRRAELSFDDVLRRLYSALTNEHGAVLAERICQQFPVAMIDEFQDTDPVQWAMFDRVYGASLPEKSVASDRALLLIGDPKQAIYGFRGADIHTYLQARQATQGRHYSLATNFRSTEALVASVNRVFDWAETQWPEAAFRFAAEVGAGDGKGAAAGESAGDAAAINAAAGEGAVERSGAAAKAEANLPAAHVSADEPNDDDATDSPTLAEDNPMPFVPVAAKGRDECLLLQGQPAAALNWWWLAQPQLPEGEAAAEPEEGEAEADAGAARSKPRKGSTAMDDGVRQGAYRHQMAEACASQMAEWLRAVPQGHTGFLHPNGRMEPLRPRDMAVLVRSRTEADAIRSALSARDIASAYLSERESVFDSVEAQDFSVWLEAVHSDGQGSRLRAALATASLGRSHAWLDRLNQDEGLWDEQVVRFRGYNQIWREHGVLPMTRAMLHDFALPSAWLDLPNGARTLTNVLHLAEWLQKQAAQFDSQQALMRELLRQIESESEASDGARLRLESDDDLIKVVTIHKSKGLEYPLVFLPFIAAWANVPNQRKSMVLPAAEAGAPRRVNLDVGHPADKALEDLERQREDLRLLYVAMTRARHAMWLGVAPLTSSRGKACEMENSALGYLLGGKAKRTAVGLHESLRVLSGMDANAHTDAAPIMALGTLPAVTQTHWQPPDAQRERLIRAAPQPHWQRWWVASYTAMTHGLKDEDSRPEPLGTEAPEPMRGRRAVQPEPETVASEHLHEAALEAQQQADQLWQDQPEHIGHSYGDEGEALLGTLAQQAHQAPQGVHAFFRGATAGTFLHELLEICAMQGFARMLAEPDKLHDLVRRRAAVLGWEAQAPALTEWLQSWLQAPIALSAGALGVEGFKNEQYGALSAEKWADKPNTGHSICLKDLGFAQAKPEMEFLLPVNLANSGKIDQLVRQHVETGKARPQLSPTWLNGMLKGFMDLVFEAPAPDGTPCFYVLDYKSNWLGPDDRHYHPEALRDAALKNRYDLQGALYQLALHRLLRTRLGSGYDPQRHLGGSITWFLRGVGQIGSGVWLSKAPLALLNALDALLEGRQA